jgi:hypothetical protein
VAVLGPSFERQWRGTGTCAIHAIRHALLCLGVPVDSRDVEGAMGAGLIRRLIGNDERAVERGLARLGYGVDVVDMHDAGEFRCRIDRELEAGRPMILCVDDESHWLVVAGRWAGRYVLIDSDRHDLFGASTWGELGPRIRYHGSSGPAYWAMTPRARAGEHEPRSLVPRVAEAWDAMKGDARLRRAWAVYLDFALELDRLAQRSGELLFEFIDREGDALRAGLACAFEGELASELARVSWVAYCHQTRIPSREAAAAALGAFVTG